MSVINDATSRYRAASEAKDIDAVMDALAPQAELISPLSGRMAFRGAQDLRVLLAAIYGNLHQLHWHEEIGEGNLRVILGEARVWGVTLTDAMVVELTEDGHIARIRPHLRPWLALTLLAIRLLPTIARHPGLVRRALRAA
ncbi:MAG: nuclear transport factor 2 family protein [Sciscionella sp.]